MCDWTAAAANQPGALSFPCVALLNQASAEIGHVNLYDIYGDWCACFCILNRSESFFCFSVLLPFLTLLPYGQCGRAVPLQRRPLAQ